MYMELETKGSEMPEGELRQWANLIGIGVDEGRGAYVPPSGPNVLNSPKRIKLEDFMWTKEEVELTLIAAARAERAIGDKEQRFLKGYESSHPETFSEPGDYPDLDRVSSLRVPAHNIDQYEDVLEWIVMIKGKENRRLVMSVIRQKAAGREKVQWSRVQKESGLWTIKTEGIRTRYRRLLEKLAQRLTDERFSRRRRS